jgi:hypothetical protein
MNKGKVEPLIRNKLIIQRSCISSNTFGVRDISGADCHPQDWIKPSFWQNQTKIWPEDFVIHLCDPSGCTGGNKSCINNNHQN